MSGTGNTSVSLRPQLPLSGFVTVNRKRIGYYRDPQSPHGIFVFPLPKGKGVPKGPKLKLDQFVRKDVQGKKKS